MKAADMKSADKKRSARLPLLGVCLLSACLLAGCDAPPAASNNETANAAVAAPEAAPAAAAPATAPVDAGLATAIAGAWRDPDNVARDQYRHPQQTLAFFGVQPGQTIIEITPGGGWYAEILAPYLHAGGGTYIAAIWDDAIEGQPDYRYASNKSLREKFAGNAEVYGTPELRAFDPAAPVFGPAGSADAVLTFRNVHNWVADGTAPAYFAAFFDVLKPGGTLGVADHRAKPDTSLEAMKESGYLTEALVLSLAKDAGFELVEQSDINANPKDSADHVNGVWTLPPTNSHDDADDAKYQEIGESDRMTLRFRKPE